MSRFTLFSALLACGLIASGCGPESKIADKPSAEMIKADEEQQKKIEAEERGTPIKAKKK